MSKDNVQNVEFYTISREEKNILFRLSSLLRENVVHMIYMYDLGNDPIGTSANDLAEVQSDNVLDTCKFIFEQILSKKISNYQSNWFSDFSSVDPDSLVILGEYLDGQAYIAFPRL